MPYYYLEMVRGSVIGQKYLLNDGAISVGRSSQNTIALPPTEKSVSAHHMIIYKSPERIMVQDMQSTNGTFVNNRKIYEKTPLYDGDEVRLGNITLLFEGESQLVDQMVEIGDEDEGLFSTTMAPDGGTRFLPEYNIVREKDLRIDYEKLRVTYELQNEMNLERDISKTLDRILARTFEFLEYDHGVILLMDKNGVMTPHSFKTRKVGEKLTISSTLLRYVQEEKSGVISRNLVQIISTWYQRLFPIAFIPSLAC